ncbi:MAG: trimethylamine methyltransferase family protein [Eubacterium sp.]|nr:trimethylamine methyltransferase family protein [Eubacterium sp.]
MRLRYSFSKATECEQVHEYSLDILKNTGVIVRSERARALLKKHGAKISDMKAFMPEALVTQALKTAPESFGFKTPGHRVSVGGEALCTLPSYGATYVRRNGKRFLGTRKDFVNFTKLIQMNEELSLSCPYVLEPYDLPLEHRNAYKMVMSLKYSDKPTFSITEDGESARESIDMARRYFGDDSSYLLMGNVNISAPLLMSQGTAEAILVHGEKNQPVMVACGSGLSGLTAPPMPAANLLLSNSGVLAGVVLSQCARPGLPVIYGFPLFAVDPYNAGAAVGSPVTALFTMAAAEMGRFYKLPVRAGGTFTDAEQLDFQSGFESFMNLFSSLYAGVDCLMHTFGMEEGLNTLNYNKFILDEALYHTLQEFLGGFEINDVTLMAQEIQRAGCDGNYIGMRNLRLIRKQYRPYPFGEAAEEETVLEKTDLEIERRLEAYRMPESTAEQRDYLEGLLPRELVD